MRARPELSVGWLVVVAIAICVGGESRAHEGVTRQIERIEEQLLQEPTNADLYLRRGELHRIHRDWKTAESDYLKARSLNPKLAAVDLCLGELFLDSDQPAKSVAPLERFLTAHPDHFRGLLTRARAFARTGRSKKAVADYDRAITSVSESPTLPEAYLERARVLMQMGPKSLDRALSGLDEGLERLGRPITLQLLAIDLEQQRERWDAAIARIDQIASASPRKEVWWIRRGEIEQRAGRTEDALRSFRQAISSIESLPEHRRQNRAVQLLESTALDAIASLDSQRER